MWSSGFFFKLLSSSSRIIALGSTQGTTEMNTRNLPADKKTQVLKTDNLADIYEPIV
jgi:hypothetical protein